jgi:transcriptional regulator with XRE-family HTH domain
MENGLLGRRVKELRVKNGYSQESLAEACSVSLRTIQRIECGATIPRGFTLSHLAAALHVGPDELVDWSKQEDLGQLQLLNLSALSLLINPFLGVIMPLVLWISKREKIEHLDETGTRLLNFQLSMLLLISLAIVAFIATVVFVQPQSAVIGFGKQPTGPNSVTGQPGDFIVVIATISFLALIGAYYVYSVSMVIFNSIRIQKTLPLVYRPAIPFLR